MVSRRLSITHSHWRKNRMCSKAIFPVPFCFLGIQNAAQLNVVSLVMARSLMHAIQKGLVKWISDIIGSSACAIYIPVPHVWCVKCSVGKWILMWILLSFPAQKRVFTLADAVWGFMVPGRSIFKITERVTFDSDWDRLGITRARYFLVQISKFCDVHDRQFRDFLVWIKCKIRWNTSLSESGPDVRSRFPLPLLIFDLRTLP